MHQKGELDDASLFHKLYQMDLTIPLSRILVVLNPVSPHTLLLSAHVLWLLELLLLLLEFLLRLA